MSDWAPSLPVRADAQDLRPAAAEPASRSAGTITSAAVMRDVYCFASVTHKKHHCASTYDWICRDLLETCIATQIQLIILPSQQQDTTPRSQPDVNRILWSEAWQNLRDTIRDRTPLCCNFSARDRTRKIASLLRAKGWSSK